MQDDYGESREYRELQHWKMRAERAELALRTRDAEWCENILQGSLIKPPAPIVICTDRATLEAMSKRVSDVGKSGLRAMIAELLVICPPAERAELFAPYNHETGERK